MPGERRDRTLDRVGEVSKTMYSTLEESMLVELSDEQLARIDERAERGDDAYYAYYADIPEITDEFLRNAKVVYPASALAGRLLPRAS